MKLLSASRPEKIAGNARYWRAALGAAGLILAASEIVSAQGTSSYEPSSRQRLRSETCMKDEMDQGVLCVKRCDPDFKLEESGKKLICRATKSGAVRKVPQAEYQPPATVPSPPSPKSGY